MSSSDARPSLYRAQTGATSRTRTGAGQAVGLRVVGPLPPGVFSRPSGRGRIHVGLFRVVLLCRAWVVGPLHLDQLLLGGPAVSPPPSPRSKDDVEPGGLSRRDRGGRDCLVLAALLTTCSHINRRASRRRHPFPVPSLEHLVLPVPLHPGGLQGPPEEAFRLGLRQERRRGQEGSPPGSVEPAGATGPLGHCCHCGGVGTVGVEEGHKASSGTEKCKAGDRTGASARMADDGRAKRLKPSQDGGVAEVTELRARVAELESENAKLRLENLQQAGGIAALASDNEQLSRRGQAEGNHDVLPVTVTVDLSRVTTGIVTHISSFLASSRELLNLALTCKSFGWRQPMSTLNWSLVEEVARQAVFSRATDDEMGCLPRYVSGTATWLSILHRYEHLLMFDVLLGGYIEHRNGDKTAVRAKGEDYYDSVAVSGSYVMSSVAHYAEFLITGKPCIGIVRPMPGLNAGAYQEIFFLFYDNLYPDFRAQRTDDWGNSDVHACEYDCDSGVMNRTNWEDYEMDIEWEGREGCQSGDTVGMLLNLDEGTLTIYKNNRRLGVMMDGLSGPYCWYVSLYNRPSVTDEVSIKRGTLPDFDGATRT
ncbi:hypothetical protein THAOC_01870 [Thalassiosira oceanica]|uniref:SPRY domain-containing protein n=1 Tax=Thalassiosira oceanica TaxID=159749 RepID=K0TMM9_THAOC|nr:hypothetical protein THAOC_01870 [Thalassiosira oceanica]|eukprot:EJK76371.1 hypothetical protein THAOC_01870 [Thalassiosira oceanica]